MLLHSYVSRRRHPLHHCRRRRHHRPQPQLWLRMRRARDKCCQARPIELLGCSAYVVVGVMRLQPACQQLKPPVYTVDAMGAWRLHACIASIVSRSQ